MPETDESEQEARPAPPGGWARLGDRRWPDLAERLITGLTSTVRANNPPPTPPPSPAEAADRAT